MENVQAVQAQSGDSRQRRRMIPIIDARFQWKYTLLIMALGVGLTAIMGAFLYKAHVDNTRLLDLAGNARLQAEVMRGDQIFLLYLLTLIVLMGVGLGLSGLIVTHRISGPLYIVARYLNILASGRYPDLRPLRKRDELHEFFSTFEDAISSMRDRDTQYLKTIDDALAKLDEAGVDRARAALEELRSSIAGRVGSDG